MVAAVLAAEALHRRGRGPVDTPLPLPSVGTATMIELGSSGTGRNWNTILKLVELAQ